MHHHGLIIGKFDPPHLGHKHLIDFALQSSKQLTLLLCISQQDAVPWKLRMEWLMADRPQLHIFTLDQDVFDRSDSKAWITATKALILFQPDCIFSSETYGLEYAELMGCLHVMVDRERVNYPCSASQIKQNPAEFLEYLEPKVAAYFLKIR